jgi:lysozyme family protein
MADAKIAINLTLVHEGGFQNDPGDPGNWTGGAQGVGELKGTKFGISAHEFPDLDIKNLTQDQAIDAYTHGRPPDVPPYWNSLFNQINDQVESNKIFDLGFLFGPGTVIKYAQGLLKLVEDGIFGPHTLAALNAAEPQTFVSALKAVLVSHAIGIANARPAERKDLVGWISRINS